MAWWQIGNKPFLINTNINRDTNTQLRVSNIDGYFESIISNQLITPYSIKHVYLFILFIKKYLYRIHNQ